MDIVPSNQLADKVRGRAPWTYYVSYIGNKRSKQLRFFLTRYSSDRPDEEWSWAFPSNPPLGEDSLRYVVARPPVP